MEATAVPEERAWGKHYNLACYDAAAGDADAAFEELRTALALNRAEAMKWLPHDTDLDSLRDDPRFEELTR
jgi:adenylate cyclase